MSLLRMELLRIRSRRLFRGLTLLALAGFLLAAIIVFFQSKEEVAFNVVGGDPAFVECLDDTSPPSNEEGTVVLTPEGMDPDMCREVVSSLDPRFNFIEIHSVFEGLSIPFLSLAWLLGASAMGAEWPNRTMTSLLTWEPRRTRVFAAKYAAATISAAMWVIALCVVLAGVLAAVAALRGTFDGVDSTWMGDFVLLILRIGGGAALAAALGSSVATVGRNTAAALGAGFVYLAILENLARSFKPAWQEWLLADNLGLFLVGPAEVSHLGHSQIAAGFVLLAYAGILAAVALALFTTREVA